MPIKLSFILVVTWLNWPQKGLYEYLSSTDWCGPTNSTSRISHLCAVRKKILILPKFYKFEMAHGHTICQNENICNGLLLSMWSMIFCTFITISLSTSFTNYSVNSEPAIPFLFRGCPLCARTFPHNITSTLLA